MSKRIVDHAITGLILAAIFEVGVILGINLVKSGIFYAPTSLLSINGIPKAFIVTSGSMEPTIKTGGLVLSIPLATYKPDDVVTFENSADHKTLVTHRIVSENNQIFITKGDANNTGDETRLNKSQIIGKAVIAFPQLGYFANSIKDPKMFILLVIVPATIVIYEELKFLKKSLLKKIGLFLNKFKPEEDNGSNKLFVFIPVFAIAFILTGITGSFFTDTKISSGNLFTTGTFPTTPPSGIATQVVISEVQIKGDGRNINDDEFVELYNPTSTQIVMDRWRLTRKNSAGSQENLVLILSGTIPAFRHFLIVDGDGYNGSVSGDALYSAPHNALTNNYTVLLYSDAGTLVDKVGFGVPSDSETTPFSSNPSNNGSIERKAYSSSTEISMTSGPDATMGNGYDTDNNSNDFVTRTTSDPQNTASSPEMP